MDSDKRLRYHYEVQVPLAGSDHFFPLCVAAEPEAAGAVLVALLRAGGPDPVWVRVEKRPAD